MVKSIDHTAPAPSLPESTPQSELDRQLEKARSGTRNRISQRAVAAIVGSPEESGFVGASRGVRSLEAIADSETPLDELDRQLEKAKSSRRNRFARRAVATIIGSPEDSGLVGASREVMRLEAIREDMVSGENNDD